MITAVAPQTELYKVTAPILTGLDLAIGDHFEAVPPKFYDDNDLVLANLDGFLIVGRLNVCGANRFSLHVPGSAAGPELTYYADRSQLIGLVCKQTSGGG